MNTKQQTADMLTKGVFTSTQWIQLCNLAQIRFSTSHLLAFSPSAVPSFSVAGTMSGHASRAVDFSWGNLEQIPTPNSNVFNSVVRTVKVQRIDPTQIVSDTGYKREVFQVLEKAVTEERIGGYGIENAM